MCGNIRLMFNYQSRWDRELPTDKSQKSGTPIAVTCLINKGQITPKSLSFRNRTLQISKVNFHWTDKQGRETLTLFSVKTEAGTYEISFFHASLSWHLNKLLGP